MELIWFVLGTLCGSFINVIASRKVKLADRSRCDTCLQQLMWFELIPVGSFILQRGKCRYCKINIPIYFFIFEITSGFAFVLVTPVTLHRVLLLGILMLLQIISVKDLLHYQFNIGYPIIIFVLATFYTKYSYLMILVLLIIYLVVLYLNHFFNWIGNGDLDLMLGLFIAFNLATANLIILMASLLGLLSGICYQKHRLPFVPFLYVGTILVLCCQRVFSLYF